MDVSAAPMLSGTLAHRDVRARAYRDVFTAFPESTGAAETSRRYRG
jgi:hypothetical protein